MKYLHYLFLFVVFGCQPDVEQSQSSYFDTTSRIDVLSGGVRMIPIQTPNGEFKVWTKRTGNNPTIKVLLLHGGPGITHEYFEACDSYFPGAEIEYYYYDQLESHYSEKPNDTTLWNIPHYVEEVEQVRLALGLDQSNFYLYGNSWGGILGIEYALKYQQHIKGLIIANMVSSIPHYNKYANEVLAPQLPADVLKEIKELEANEDYLNPRYGELLTQHYYTAHILRKPLDEWPDGVNRAFEHINYPLYLNIQGPSEFGIVGNAKLQGWDRSKDLPKIKVPTLVIGAKYDTMDPDHMEWMSTQFPQGQYLYCENGSHLAMYDDQEVFFEGLIKFIKEVDKENSPL
ncbi:MAG: proline iminopeptidase [Bacteroidetes bacterium]|nr:MAG: proline iminopeptidase [Bacteroidota bacterium]